MIPVFIGLALISQMASAQIMSLQNQPPLLANLGNNGFNNLNSNCFGSGNGIGSNGIILGKGIGNNGINLSNGLGNGLNIPFTTGPGFPTSPGIPAYGIQITADALEIGGSLGVVGQLPITGTVAVNGNVPTDGAASVNYSCGQLSR